MSHTKHILIVDDVADNIPVAMNILQEDNYEFSFADTGNKALSILQKEDADVDLILLDIMMPGLVDTFVEHLDEFVATAQIE